MENLSLLIAILVVLIFASAFFSASETGMMAINRYRLRHLARSHHKTAKLTQRLLERTDRLLSVILAGNTLANMLASSVATVIAIELYGNVNVAPLAGIVIAVIILIFSEVIPKTLAALYPERAAFSVARILSVLLKVFYPAVWCLNNISNAFLRIFNVRVDTKRMDDLTSEEVRTLVHETSGQLSRGSKHMMLGVLDLGGMTVDDIKVPRGDILGIDLDDSWETNLEKLSKSEHTRLPVYRENIDQVIGILHLRKALNIAAKGQLNPRNILNYVTEAYFIPEGTPLNVQLLNFREKKQRIGLIVDEYGDIQGLLTLEDILEEIVGEFTTSLTPISKNIQRQRDGSYLVNGSISVRDLNRQLQWELPVGGPKTLSGLIIEQLEIIPDTAVSLRIKGYPMEVIGIEENTVKMVRIWPELRG